MPDSSRCQSLLLNSSCTLRVTAGQAAQECQPLCTLNLELVYIQPGQPQEHRINQQKENSYEATQSQFAPGILPHSVGGGSRERIAVIVSFSCRSRARICKDKRGEGSSRFLHHV